MEYDKLIKQYNDKLRYDGLPYRLKILKVVTLPLSSTDTSLFGYKHCIWNLVSFPNDIIVPVDDIFDDIRLSSTINLVNVNIVNAPLTFMASAFWFETSQTGVTDFNNINGSVLCCQLVNNLNLEV